ncbi:MAG: hypothetical protein H6728_13340 [Myxococcales bacterium]|nr:hypothetical protein [Myxococcales bacterium]
MSRSTRELQIDAYINQARLHASRGEQEKALYYWGLVIQVDPENPQARAYFQQLGTSSRLDAVRTSAPNERWNTSAPPPWHEDYRGGAPRSPYPHSQTPPPLLPLEEARLKGLQDVENSWQASELELPMEYEDSPNNQADFLSPYSRPSPLSRSAAEWLATVSDAEEEGQTIIAPARSALNEVLRSSMEALPPLEPSALYHELPPAFAEPEITTARPVAPPQVNERPITRPPTMPPLSQPPSQPPPSRTPSKPPPSRPLTQPPAPGTPTGQSRSSINLPRASRTSAPQQADEMLARALAMALSKEQKTSTGGSKANLPTTRETRSSAHWSRTQSSPQQRTKPPTPSPSATPSQNRLAAAMSSQQRLSSARATAPNTGSASNWKASRSQNKLVSATPAPAQLTDENQKKLEALVRALDSALRTEASEPAAPKEPELMNADSSKGTSSLEDDFAAEALTGQFPVLKVAPPSEEEPAYIPPNPSPAKSTEGDSAEQAKISGKAINQAAERLTAELRASLAFFSTDELEKGQEDPESMINEILDIIAGHEQKSLSQETLTAILDQTLQNLQGPQYDYASVDSNFTPAGLESMSASQVQLHAVTPPLPAKPEEKELAPRAPQAAPVSAAPSASNEDEEAFEELFKQAMTTYLRRQYKQALSLFEECLRLRPDDQRTLYNVERLRKRVT